MISKPYLGRIKLFLEKEYNIIKNSIFAVLFKMANYIIG